jgi:hypothetical protein
MDKLWFEGSHEIDCSIQQVKKAFENLGMHYIELVGLMPGISTVELVDEYDQQSQQLLTLMVPCHL